MLLAFAGCLAALDLKEDQEGTPEPDNQTDTSSTEPTGVAQGDPVTLGDVSVGCTGEGAVVFRNTGTTDLIVSAVEIFGTEEWTMETPSLPWTISPGASDLVDVSFTPWDVGAESANVKLTFQDGDLVVPADATGVEEARVEEFDLFSDAPLDLVLALDRSCSMNEPTLRLEESFAAFVSAIGSTRLDYHVSIVVAEDGCPAGDVPFIDPTMSGTDQVAALEAMVAGDSGGNPGAGFTLLETATRSANVGRGGCSEGLLRPEGRLGLVGVSDKGEHSANDYSYYVALLQTLTDDPYDMTVNAVVGDYPDGCDGADPGADWYQATVATGGAFRSICDGEWDWHWDAILAAAAARETVFTLGAPALADSIVVTIDSVLFAGWTFDEPSNTVSVPAGTEGRSIEIAYVVAPEC